jgi:predicted house-cleaning noncanonical NTP pyrophosphatase (MazG superfamily)
MDEVTKAINHFSVLMEQVLHEVQATNEGVAAIREKVETLATKKQVEELADKVEVIQKAVTATNRDLAEHKRMSADAAHGSGHIRRSGWAAA